MFTWAGKPFTLDIAESDRVFDLKAALQSLTDVPPERQKILGLVKGKLPPDQERVYVYSCVFSISGMATMTTPRF
jgi:ubiquitin-like domain-containing CTD phosphatase 1